MKIEKLRSKTLKELTVELEQRKIKLYNYELDLKSGKEKDTGKVRSLRRDVARILTLMNQKAFIKEVVEEAKMDKKEKVEKEETVKEEKQDK